MAVKSVIEAVREAIREEMDRDSKVFVMGEDVGIRGGVFLATQGLAEEFGNERIIDAPLAEASIMVSPWAPPSKACGRSQRFSSRISSGLRSTN